MCIGLSEEAFNKEWVGFWGNMMKYGLDGYYNEDELKDTLMNAAGALTQDSGVAQHGGLIVYINLFTAVAFKVAKMVSGTFNIDDNVLGRICLLQHLSKADMFVENESEWHKKNLGQIFKFAELEGKLKFGARSVLYATQKGIVLSPVEYEAITVMDNEDEVKGAKNYYSIYSTIVRIANDLATAILREREKKGVA